MTHAVMEPLSWATEPIPCLTFSSSFVENRQGIAHRVGQEDRWSRIDWSSRRKEAAHVVGTPCTRRHIEHSHAPAVCGPITSIASSKMISPAVQPLVVHESHHQWMTSSPSERWYLIPLAYLQGRRVQSTTSDWPMVLLSQQVTLISIENEPREKADLLQEPFRSNRCSSQAIE